MKNYTYFPPQKLPTSKKTKQWFKDCVDTASNMILLSNTKELELKHKMQVWYNLDNDIIDEKEIEKVFNPMQIAKGEFPASIKNYSICSQKIDLIVGEELKRKFDFSVVSKSDEAFSTYSKNLRDDILSACVQSIESETFDERKLKERLTEINKYYSYEYKELSEVTASQIIQYLWKEQDIKEKFFQGYRDALVSRQEIYRIDSYGNKPVLIKCDPRNVFSIRRGNSARIEDSDIIIEITYEPIGKIIDEFYEDLSSDDISTLEEGFEAVIQDKGGLLNYHHKEPVIYSNLDFYSNTLIPLNRGYSESGNEYGSFYDEEGNVRVIRVKWLSRKKIGKLTYFDENGNERQRFVSEYYKVNESMGEHIQWIWVNEACEGTKLAENIYPRCRVRPVQMRHFDNPSMCFLGYVGTDYGVSLMEKMEPFQYAYNIYMRRLELAMAKFHGAIYELDTSKKPDDWEFEQWMYYADVLGYLVVDSFREGKKGEAEGKLAGTYNTTGKVMEGNVGNYIQQIVSMLQYIEQQVGKISGVTEQREGQISNRETVGGVERSVTQSSHITEKWFFIHEQTKKRVLQALLDTSKQLYSKSDSVNLNFILDDMSKVFLQFNGEDFASSEHDIFISNSSQDQELRDLIKGLSQAAVQNGASLALPIKVLKSDSMTKMAKLIEQDENERAQKAQNLEEQKIAVQDQISQRDAEEKQKDRELKYYEIDSKNQIEFLKLGQENEITEAPEDNSLEIRKVEIAQKKQSLEERKAAFDKELKNKQLNETIRHNKAAETVSRIKKTTPSGKAA